MVKSDFSMEIVAIQTAGSSLCLQKCPAYWKSLHSLFSYQTNKEEERKTFNWHQTRQLQMVHRKTPLVFNAIFIFILHQNMWRTDLCEWYELFSPSLHEQYKTKAHFLWKTNRMVKMIMKLHWSYADHDMKHYIDQKIWKMIILANEELISTISTSLS